MVRGMLIFEVLQIALGSRERVTAIPSGEEWLSLYRSAMEMGVCGIVYRGVMRMKEREAEDCEELDEVLFLKWTGRAMRGMERNREIERETAKVVGLFEGKGYEAMVLKGSALLRYYPEELAQYRGTGDIDVWVRKKKEGKQQPEVYDYVRSIFPEAKGGYLHIDFPAFRETNVEVHVRPCYLNNPWRNRRLQQWAEGLDFKHLKEDETRLATFNAVFLLIHIFKHYLKGEVNMKQLLDYYMVCRCIVTGNQRQEVKDLLGTFGVLGFYNRLMPVIDYLFEGASPLSKESDSLRKDILTQNPVTKSMTHKIARFVRLSFHYPSEVLFWPWAAMTRNRRG